jgi:DNA uptake protein ComE-like DNA-binding protein
VAPRGKKEATSDDWLIEGAEPARAEAADEAASEDDFSAIAPPPRKRSVAKNVGAATRQWLAIPKPGNGEAKPKAKPKAKATPKPQPEKGQELADRQREEISDLGKRIRDLQTELRTQAKEAKAEIAKTVKERDELSKRVEQLESQLADAKNQVAAKTTRRRTAPKAEAKTPPKAEAKAPAKAPARRGGAAKRNGGLDLNSATFEELRGLGLSVTQSARLIAYRDVRGGYSSLDELDEIPGLSEETRGELRAQLQLG